MISIYLYGDIGIGIPSPYRYIDINSCFASLASLLSFLPFASLVSLLPVASLASLASLLPCFLASLAFCFTLKVLQYLLRFELILG